MSKPMDDIALTYESVMAEIEAMKMMSSSRPKVAFDELHDQCLLKARPGRPDGVRWADFMKFWKARGFPGELNTLRKRLHDLLED